MSSKDYKFINGFTLVEIIVSVAIIAFIAVIAVAGLRTITAGDRIVEKAVDENAAMRYPARIMQDDLYNVYRDTDFDNIRFQCEFDEDTGLQHLKFYIVSMSNTRVAKPESDVYEVEYFVSTKNDKSYLMRRCCPNPSDDSKARGILNVVAENVLEMNIKLWDGSQWLDQWSKEQKRLPEMIDVTIWFWPDVKSQPMKVNFMANWPRTGMPSLNDSDNPFGVAETETEAEDSPEVEAD
jgi:type II secretion system protein J